MNKQEWSAFRTAASAAAVGILTGAILLTVARFDGRLDKPVGVSILEANRCDPQPCWQGIRPGTMRFDQMVAYLHSQGALLLTASGSDPCWYLPSAPLWRSCARSLHGDLITYVDVELPPGELRLGDAILQFGEPIGLELCPVVNARLPNLPPRFVGAFVSFRHGVWLLAYNPLSLNGESTMIDPGMIVWQMSYHGVLAQVDSSDFDWYGFSERSAQNQWCIQE